jgi:2-polyprenyl-3-methyl-5-hydroxy-6-metoxy-1,4-benzoquinol methylase
MIYEILEQINARPRAFEFYTAAELWTDEHTSSQMLALHLSENIDAASRKGKFIDKSVEWLANRFSIQPGTKVMDLGCGPGLYAGKLARMGARVTGVDFSARSIRYARNQAKQEALEIEYINESYLEFTPPGEIDLVLMIMCDFCALSGSQRTMVLNKMLEALKPGGHVVLDVYSHPFFDAKTEIAIYEKNMLNGFWSASDYYAFLNSFKYDAEKLILDKYTIIEKDRTRNVYNWLQTFTPLELEAILLNHGLRVTETYRDVAGATFDETHTEFAVVAQKL